MKLRNTIFNFFANIFYYIVAVPILFVVDKVFFDYKVVGKENVKKVPGGKNNNFESYTLFRLYNEWAY